MNNLENLLGSVKAKGRDIYNAVRDAGLILALSASIVYGSSCGGGSDPAPVSEAPVYNPVGNESKSVDENQPFSYTVDVNDLQGDPVTLSAVGTPSWAVWNAGSGVVSGTPTYNDSGITTMTIMADDGNGNTTDKDLEIIVNNVNRLPVITVSGTTTVNEGDVIEASFTVTDPDGDSPIDFWINNAPIGSNFDSGSLTLSWVTGYSDSGTHTLNLVADDMNGGVTNQPLGLVVNDVVNPERIISVYNDGAWKLASMLPDGSDLQVINAPGTFKGRPRWYPGDRSLITYFRSDNPGVAGHDPRLANADGTGELKILDSPDVDKMKLVVSQDKTLIAYLSEEPGYRKVYIADWNDLTKSASNSRALNLNTNVESWPDMDGQWVYYAADKGGNWEICRFRRDQTGLEQNLTNTSLEHEDEVCLFYDGTKMIYSSGGLSSSPDLYISDSDGTNPVKLISNVSSSRAACPSSDGNWIVYSLEGDLFKIRKDGKFNHMISDGSDEFYDLNW